jgi:hypothetical protein
MATFYDDGDFTTAQINGDDRVERPFSEQDDKDTQVIYRPMLVNRSNYVPLELDTPHPTVIDAYLTMEIDHADYGTGLMSFTRVYAQIPATRNGVFTGTQAFTYPGFNTDGSTLGTVQTITAESDDGTITTLTATNTVEIGDIIYVVMTWTGTVSVAFTGYRVALTGTTGSAVKVAFIAGGETFSTGTLTELDPAPRAQDAKLTGSITDFTYFLPGVTDGITLPTDVTEDETFKILSTATLSATSIMSATTIPNFVAYQALIDAGAYITVSSEVTRWKGNIIQKANRKIRAL